MNRQRFQDIADIRLKEAKALLDVGFFEGAFYLAGYVAECALKACIAKKTHEYDFPPDPDYVRSVYTHNLKRLLMVAELNKKLEVDAPKGSPLDQSWATAYLWSENSRYERVTMNMALDLYNAIADPNPQRGVLAWLRQYW